MNSKQAPTAIVVGVDGSESSIAALRHAEKLAIRLGSPLQALTCWTIPTIYQVPHALGAIDFKGAAEKILNTAVGSAFGMDWPENLTTRLEQGPPRQTLIDASRNAALLVLGRRGLGGFRGLLMGSVSSACTIHAHCPVMVVHATDEGAQNA